MRLALPAAAPLTRSGASPQESERMASESTGNEPLVPDRELHRAGIMKASPRVRRRQRLDHIHGREQQTLRESPRRLRYTVGPMALTARETNAKYKETSEDGLAVSLVLC